MVLAFGAAFVLGSLVAFGAAAVIGHTAGLPDLPTGWRHGAAAIGLVALMAIDVVSLRRASYCSLGWRRQASKRLAHRHSPITTAAAWGLDAGLVVTTFRVTALAWGALLFVTLGLVSWLAGLVYAIGFVVPLSILLCVHRVGRSAAESSPSDPGLQTMLRRRPLLQRWSTGLLTAGAVVLVVTA